nr:hypothetical protein [Psychrobacter sp.]
MYIELRGSDLTRAMLERGDEKVWCAISDESDKQAITDLTCNDFMAHIVAFEDGFFYCTGGMQWLHAVPAKIIPMTFM